MNWVSMMLYVVKAHFFLEVVGGKGELWIDFLYDIVRYIDICANAGLNMNLLELNLYTQIDILDCELGFAGLVIYIIEQFDHSFSSPSFWGFAFGDHPYHCEWREYKLEIPFAHFGFDTFGINYLSYHSESGIGCINPPEDPNPY